MTEQQETYRDHISTVDASGKRIWLFPRQPEGRFYRWRTWMSFGLLAILFGMPFIKVNGEPFMLFNVIERKFILFSVVFTPQDLHLFALAMITFMVFIVLFTVVFGRLFCGWVCPQTIFMEMVFRKIEYWIEGNPNQQRKLKRAPWTTDKLIKKGSKHAIFFVIAVLIANTFLSYIIGVEAVFQIISEPIAQHVTGFIAMLIFSFAFYFVFARMREQVCIAICPYGRLQGVLLDENSIVVAYDQVRGEPRSKLKGKKTKAKNPVESIQSMVGSASTDQTPVAAPTPEVAKVGDCIDCNLCVQVCPTGIDIRNGTQLECVNCTACIDACDAIMDKIEKPRGLIRYDSLKGIEEGKRNLFNNRVKAYSVILALLVGLQFFLFSNRTEVEALILRTPGMLYEEVEDGKIRNLYNYQIINKTGKVIEDLSFSLSHESAVIKTVGHVPDAQKQAISEGALFIEIKKDQLKSRVTELQVEIFAGDKKLDEVTVSFLKN